MHDEIGAFYMFCLASEMADRMSAPLFTDSPTDAEMGQALLFEPQAGEQVSDMLVSLGIQLPSPEQLQYIPMQQVAEFAEHRSAERQEFRSAMEGIVTAATAHADPNAINDYLSSQRRSIETAVTTLRATIDELGVGAISGVAKITVPAGALAAIAALPLSPLAAAILGALGLAIAESRVTPRLAASFARQELRRRITICSLSLTTLVSKLRTARNESGHNTLLHRVP